MRGSDFKIAVVIPCYKVKAHILQVLAKIGPEVDRIYVVDDCCPEKSGDFVMDSMASGGSDPRVTVLYHEENQGVGGAVMTGYQAAIDDDMDVIVKIDGDDQMDPALLPAFVRPIIEGAADYTKGNRFFDLESVQSMPRVRLLGNAVLSFMAKLSSGYWNLFDPTNGYTAIHAEVAKHLPFDKISKRYFFETDILFRLNIIKAVVVDIPMEAKYADEVSNLKIKKIVGEFFFKHARNFLKRLFYNYYLRGMSVASFALPLGCLLVLFGLVFGGYKWFVSSAFNDAASSGTVMLAALPLLVGGQLVLAFLNHDVVNVPSLPIYKALRDKYKNRFSYFNAK